jgi:hypothetical protein
MGDYPTMMHFTSTKIIGNGLILLGIILLLFIHTAHAQEFALGLKAGPLMSWSMYGDKDDRLDFDSRPTPGYYAAGIIAFPLKNNYSCILEGGYSQRGRNVLFNEGSGRNKATYSFTDAVLLLRKGYNVRLGKDVPSSVYFNIGPHINYWLNGKGRISSIATIIEDGDIRKIENEGAAFTVVFDQEPDLAQFDKMFLNNVNRWMFGLDLGVGLQAPITKTQHLQVELRFTSGHTFYGQRNSATYNWVEFQDNLRANEKVLSLTAAYTFGFNLQESKKGKSTKDKEVNRKPVKKKKKRKAGSSRIRL